MSEWSELYLKNLSTFAQIVKNWLVNENEWKNVQIKSVLEKKTFKIAGSILAKNYLKSGKFPIVSQSKDLVSGFSDDDKLLITDSLPLIIFGDHTQVLKYIDFPFILGADGVKILIPQKEYITKFFYYMLKAVDLNSSKYARHSKLLQNHSLPFKIDSIDEQESIISFFNDFENNRLTGETYFDSTTETKILSLHSISLIQNSLVHANKDQDYYLKEIRQSILREAIEGKLTAAWRVQNPVRRGDPATDAAALLEKIKQEKQKLIAEGKIKKEKPLAPISPEETPFELPEGWVWCRLGEIAEVNMGQSPDGSSYNEKGIGVPLINGPVEFGGKNPFDITTNKKFTSEPTKMCEKGDLIICVRGSTTGRTNIAGFDSCIGRGVAALKPYNLKKWYFNYLILFYRYMFYDLGTGTTFPNISFDKINNFSIPLPPLSEQQAIVDRVDKLLAMVNELEQQVKERKGIAEEMMQAVMREQFTI